MAKWEYLTVVYRHHALLHGEEEGRALFQPVDPPSKTKYTLDELGGQGWELVTTFVLRATTYHAFKRLVKESDDV